MDSQEIQILEPLALPVPGRLAMRFRVPKSLTRQADMPTPLTTTFSACKLPNKIRVDEFGSYLFIKDEEGPSGYHEFIFAPPLTDEQVQTPYRTYFDTEPSMFWPKVLLTIQTYKRLFDDVQVSRPRYKEAYQGPTRVRIEEFYSPSPFTIPVYEPMIDRGLNDEIGVQVSSPLIPGVSNGGVFWYSVGTLNLDPCLHSAINIGVVLDPPIVVTVGSITFNYNFAYLNDVATNYTDWPNEIVIDDRQREILGGFVRRRVTALSPALTLVTTPTSTITSSTAATLGGTLASVSGLTVTSRGVVYAPTATNAAPEVGGTGVTTPTPINGGTVGAFSQAVTGLTSSTAYSFKPWALTSENVRIYGPVGTFTTTALVTSPTSASVTSSGATLGGTLASVSGLTVTSRGVVYAPTATNAAPEVGGTGVTTPTPINGGTVGAFSQAVTGLTSGTAYSFKPWALTTEHGRIYGPVGTFTTA